MQARKPVSSIPVSYTHLDVYKRQVFPDFDKLTYPDWESMFRAVNYRTDKRFTLCLDEFPYLVEDVYKRQHYG